LKSGIESFIQGTASVLDQPSAAAAKRPPTMPPLPIEARPLYEILPEVKSKSGPSATEIYAPSHGYAMPQVNIQKTIDTANATTTSEKKEDD
jgi:hypothetical protein